MLRLIYKLTEGISPLAWIMKDKEHHEKKKPLFVGLCRPVVVRNRSGKLLGKLMQLYEDKRLQK